MGVGNISQQAAGEYEAALLERYPTLCDGLLRSGVKRGQRALRMCLSEPRLNRSAERGTLIRAARGSFATAVVSELIASPD